MRILGINASSIQKLIPPVAPSNVVATINATGIEVTWVDNSNNEDNFIIQRSVNGGTYGTIATLVAGVVSYQDDTARAELDTVTYKVAASNAAGDSSYTIGNTVEVPLNAPSNLNTVLNSNDSISMSWQDNSAKNTRHIWEHSIDNGAWTMEGPGAYTLEGDNNAVTETNFIEGTSVRIGVSAWEHNLDKYSARTIGSTSHVIGPNAPTGAAVADIGIDLEITWTDNSAVETGYEVEVSINGGAWNNFTTTVANATSTTYRPMNGNDYQFRVRAIGDGPASAYSTTAVITAA